jgi:hypothetical protein
VVKARGPGRLANGVVDDGRSNSKLIVRPGVPHPCQNKPDRGDKAVYSGEQKPASICVA